MCIYIWISNPAHPTESSRSTVYPSLPLECWTSWTRNMQSLTKTESFSFSMCCPEESQERGTGRGGPRVHTRCCREGCRASFWRIHSLGIRTRLGDLQLSWRCQSGGCERLPLLPVLLVQGHSTCDIASSFSSRPSSCWQSQKQTKGCPDTSRKRPTTPAVTLAAQGFFCGFTEPQLHLHAMSEGRHGTPNQRHCSC